MVADEPAFVGGEAIEGREHSKLVFTRTLSDTLRLVAELGTKYGVSLEELSHVDVRTVTIYGAAVAFLSPFFAVMHSVITHNLIDRNEELAHSTAEHFLTLEFSLAVGRSVGLALLLPLSGMGGDTPALKIVFLLISLSSIGVALAVQRMARAVAAHAGAHH